MAELLANVTLRKNGGGEAKGADALKGKIVGLYFSAHWCWPCLKFTPKLKEFYDKVKADFEVVFVSRDSSKEECENYLKESHGEWYFLPFDDEQILLLKEKYEISGIPTLVIIKPDGTIITKSGREDVEQKTPETAVQKWRST